jgi:hypothetical protein
MQEGSTWALCIIPPPYISSSGFSIFSIFFFLVCFERKKKKKKAAAAATGNTHQKGEVSSCWSFSSHLLAIQPPPPSICFEIGVYRSNIGRRVTAALCSIEGEKKSRAEVVS